MNQQPVEAIIQRIDTSAAKLEKYQENTKVLSSFTTKLGDAYTVSLRLNVDLINIVKRYNLFLDELEKLFVKIDNDTLMTSEEIRVLKTLTEQNMVAMTKEVADNASTLEQLFKKFDASNAPDTSSIIRSLSSIPTASQQTVSSLTGSSSQPSSSPPSSSSIFGGKRKKSRGKKH
jgi:hypothetical protein